MRGGRAGPHSTVLYRVIVADWHYQGQETQDFGSDTKFLSDFIDQRAREYSMYVEARLFAQKELATLPPTIAAFPILFLQPIVTWCIEWMNKFIKLRKIKRPAIMENLFYRLLADVFYPHACSLYLYK